MTFVLLCLTVIVSITLLLCLPLGHHMTKDKGGDLPYSIMSRCKNELIKIKHKFFHIPLNEDVCKENLQILRKVLNSLDLTFWLSEGTALGAIREQRFLPWDDDVDIGMWYSDWHKFKTSALPILISKGFSVDFQIMNGTFLGLSRKGEKVDIDYVKPNGKCMASPTKFCNDLIPELKFRTVTFYGNTYLCLTEEYLEFRYGNTWSIPMPYTK